MREICLSEDAPFRAADWWFAKSERLVLKFPFWSGQPFKVRLTLQCGGKESYEYFPFAVWLAVEGRQVAVLEFDEPFSTRSISIELPGYCESFLFDVESELGVSLAEAIPNDSDFVRSLLLLEASLDTTPASDNPLRAYSAVLGSFPERFEGFRSLPPRPRRADFETSAERSHSEPIFVVGCYRSATSALTWAIGQHPEVFPMEETNWLGPILVGVDAAWRYSSLAPRSPMDVYSIDRATFSASFERAIDALNRSASLGKSQATQLQRLSGRADLFDPRVQIWRSRFNPKTRWVDGTPEYVHYVPLIARMLPGARFVGVVRDPSEVVRSLLGMNAPVSSGVDIDGAFMIWEKMTKRCVEAAALLGSGKVRLLRAADLFTDPSGAMAALWKFLDLPNFPMAAEVFDLRINSSFKGKTRPDLGNFTNSRCEEIYRGLFSGMQIHKLPWSEPLNINEDHINDITADSDEVAQAFRYDCAQNSDLKPPCPRSFAGR